MTDVLLRDELLRFLFILAEVKMMLSQPLKRKLQPYTLGN